MCEPTWPVKPNYDPCLWQLVNGYPLTECVRGYLMIVGLESPDADPQRSV